MLFQDTRLQVDSSCLTTPFFNINGITVVVELSRLVPDSLRVDDLILCLIVVHLMPQCSRDLTDFITQGFGLHVTSTRLPDM